VTASSDLAEKDRVSKKRECVLVEAACWRFLESDE